MNKDVLWKCVFICIALVLVLVMVYSGLQILESTVFLMQQDETAGSRKTISRDGVDYFPRQDVTVVMVLGIDREGQVTKTEPNHGGMADMITLMIFDEKDETYTLLSLNRDTMVEMPALDENGKENGTFYGQLTYCHDFGTGLEDSCENARKTVSDFLYGIRIDYYVAMNMDAISLLNDAVGGVTVTVEDDFSQIDPEITKGEVTLKGQQAVTFVQTRRSIGDHLNLSRIRRQQEYMDGFVDALFTQMEQDDTFIISAYEEVSPYIVTDCSANVLSSLMERYGGYTMKGSVSLEGENVVGQYMEFYPDEEKLDELILQLFYAPKN